MSSRPPARTTYRSVRIRRNRVVVLFAAVVVAVAIVDARSPESAPRSTTTPRSTPPIAALPGAGDLEPDLRRALRRAATAAARDGVALEIVSGRRTAAHQEELLRDAVARYGSLEEARRWVATPETSAHVSGEAVDVGPSAAVDWLARHGPAYGLCPVYANEPWHYERRPDAPDAGCPPLYADPTEDPRLQG